MILSPFSQEELYNHETTWPGGGGWTGPHNIPGILLISITLSERNIIGFGAQLLLPPSNPFIEHIISIFRQVPWGSLPPGESEREMWLRSKESDPLHMPLPAHLTSHYHHAPEQFSRRCLTRALSFCKQDQTLQLDLNYTMLGKGLFLFLCLLMQLFRFLRAAVTLQEEGIFQSAECFIFESYNQ